MRVLSRIAAAATLVAAAYAGLPAAPASAASCPSTDGVTVVVDFHELGGGVQTACVAGGGGQTASQLFPAAGFSLDYVQRQPGFVCKVSGKPADSPCVNTPPADAYWGLYWSDGKSGRWTYATSGAGGQHVPDGGYVAFSWQGSEDSAPPGASPTAHPSASATPASGSTQGPGHASSSTPTTAHATPSGPPGAVTSPTPTGSPAATSSEPGRQKRKPAGSPTATADGSPTAAGAVTGSESPALTAASSDPADPGDDGLPAWVAPAVIVLLFGAAGGVALLRRRRAGRP